jgi:hypothetical protein
MKTGLSFIEAFLNASKVAFTRKQLYHYIQRPNSATHKIRDSVYYNLKALALARRLMLSRNPALALKVFRKPSYPIRMHLLWDSHVCHKLYHLSLLKVYSRSKKRLADVYAGKEIQDGPKNALRKSLRAFISIAQRTASRMISARH